MQAQLEFEANVREHTGKGAARATRRAGQIPLIIYGNSKPEVSLCVDANKFTCEYIKGGLMGKVIALKADKKTYFAIAREVQRHPVSDKVEHIDFMHVDEKSRVKVRVPLHYLNLDKSVGLKRGGVLNMVRRHVEVLCKVTAIPKAIDVDVADVDIGTSVHIDDVGLPEGAEATIKRNFVLCTITGRLKEEASTVVAEDAAAEGAEAAEGENTAEAGDKK
jgi:large subunit ribosomal protein L25